MLQALWEMSVKCPSPSLVWTNGAWLIRLFYSRIWGALLNPNESVQVNSSALSKEQRDEGVRPGEGFLALSHSYLNITIAHLGSCHLGKYPWEVATWEKAFGEVLNIGEGVKSDKRWWGVKNITQRVGGEEH